MPLMEQEYEDATVELCTRQFCESSGISVEFLFFYFFAIFWPLGSKLLCIW